MDLSNARAWFAIGYTNQASSSLLGAGGDNAPRLIQLKVQLRF